MPVEKSLLRDYVHHDMIEDRPYMRRSPFDSRRSATVVLLLINVVVFVAKLVLDRFSSFPADDYFALSLGGLSHGYLWQLLTYQFMHAGPLHLLVNCWVIYVFGLAVEDALGRKPFLMLYFSSGVIGGLVQELLGLWMRGPFSAPVVGASAAAFGVTTAYALLFPDRLILMFFLIPMRAKFLLLLSVVVALIGVLRPADQVIRGPYIAHGAHLGGILAGFLFVRYAIHWNWHWPQFRRAGGSSPGRLVKVSSRASGLWGRGRSSPSEDLPPEEFLSKEVDPILDKISAHGIQSLTQRERRILEAARQKMVKR